MKSAETKALMDECLRLHLDGAAVSFKKSLIIAASIAGACALVGGVLAESFLIFVASLLLVAVMALPIPFAVRYVNVSRIKDLERKLAASPDLVSSIVLLRAQATSAAGAAALGALYGARERVVVSTKAGEQFALWLPGERAHHLAEAFRATEPAEDFDTLLARAQPK